MSLANFANNRIFANAAGDRLTIGSGQTIEGAGNLGVGQTTLTNNGTVVANQSNPLVVQPGGGSGDFTNAAGGIIEATAGATLQLSAGKLINNNLIRAQDGSLIEFRNGVSVSGNGSSLFRLPASFVWLTPRRLINLTYVGNIALANNSTTTLLQGTLTNNGTITFANTGNGVDLRLQRRRQLRGNRFPRFLLNDFANNRIFANAAGDRLTIGSGQTIRGSR